MKTYSVLVCTLAIIGIVGITRCQATLTSADCSGNVTSCTGIANAECVGETCQCQQGYAASSDGTACTAIGLDGTCATDVDCSLVTNAECTSTTCQCANGYKKHGNVCEKAVSGTTCTDNGNECGDIDNAECVDTKCHCKDGFVENADTCDEKSGAVSVKSAVALMFGCLIMLLVRAL